MQAALGRGGIMNALRHGGILNFGGRSVAPTSTAYSRTMKAPKSSASPFEETEKPVVFTSPRELDAPLRVGDRHDVFLHDGGDRDVMLKVDCRS